MTKIIVPTGYMGSGSSAVGDLLREYDNINVDNKDFEYIFMHMPFGVFDFEDKLLLNNNALRSDEAIKNFRKEMTDLYSLRGYWPGNYKKNVSKKYLELLENYIENIKTSNFIGVWYYHEKYKGYKLYKRAIKNKIRKIFKKPDKLDKFDIEYSFIKEEDFYIYTSKFILDFINLLNKNSNKKNIVLDQFILPHNAYRIKKYQKYLDIKTIIVKRDPRDVFIMNKYVWTPKEVPVLYPLDVNEFCKYYKNMREAERKNMDCLYINFEDLVFYYDKTVSDIEKYLNLEKDNHKYKRRYFNPDISIRNIKIYENEMYKEEVKIIERELKDYLYITDKKVIMHDNAF